MQSTAEMLGWKVASPMYRDGLILPPIDGTTTTLNAASPICPRRAADPCAWRQPECGGRVPRPWLVSTTQGTRTRGVGS